MLNRAFMLSIGVAMGGALAAAAARHPRWAFLHVGTIMLVGLAVVAAVLAYVQIAMNGVARDHEDREEAFRIAMLAEFAPDRLARDHLTLVPDLETSA